MKKPSTIINFGKRLAEVRKLRGLSQQELAKMIGVSPRVIAYYEVETKYPPTHLLVPLARTLKVSTDELLGIRGLKQELDAQYTALWRRFRRIEKLPKSDQRALLHYLDALLRKNNMSTKDK
jgi:transcriptional regulator with XRE-family HTH domain